MRELLARGNTGFLPPRQSHKTNSRARVNERRGQLNSMKIVNQIPRATKGLTSLAALTLPGFLDMASDRDKLGISKFASIEDQPEEKNPKPKRPLSSYNLFFQDERRRMLEEMPTRPEGKPKRSHGKIGFAQLARSVAAKWKEIDPAVRAVYDERAAADKKRYVEEMEEWKKTQAEQMPPPESSKIDPFAPLDDWKIPQSQQQLAIEYMGSGLEALRKHQDQQEFDRKPPANPGQRQTTSAQAPATPTPFPMLRPPERISRSYGQQVRSREPVEDVSRLVLQLDSESIDFIIETFR